MHSKHSTRKERKKTTTKQAKRHSPINQTRNQQQTLTRRILVVFSIPPFQERRAKGLPQLHSHVLGRVEGSEVVRTRGRVLGSRATSQTKVDLGPLGHQGLAPSLTMGPAVLTSHAPQGMSLRSARPKCHLATLVGVHGAASVGGSDRGQAHLFVGSQEGKGFARRGQANARWSVSQGYRGVLRYSWR